MKAVSPSSAPIYSQKKQAYYELSKLLLTIAGLVTLVVKGCGFSWKAALIGGGLFGASLGIYIVNPSLHVKLQTCARAVRKAYIRTLCMDFIRFKRDLNTDNNGDLSVPLMWAAEIGDVQTMRALIQAGARLEVRDKLGRTALTWSAMQDQVDAIRALHAAGAQLEACDNTGWTALMWATHKRQIGAIEALHQLGANLEAEHFDGTALMVAAAKGHLTSLQALLKVGSNIETHDKRGRTALMWAAIYGQLHTLQALLNAGAQSEARDNEGKTAMILAAQQDQVGAIKALHAKGADINAYDHRHRTALISATKCGCVHAVEALCHMGALGGYCDYQGYPAYTWAFMLSKTQSNAAVQSQILKSLIQYDEHQLRYSTEILGRHWLASVWGLKGTSTLWGVTFELEGLVREYAIYQFSRYVSEFFASRKVRQLSPGRQQQICAAFANSVPLTNASNQELIDKLHHGELVVILGGTHTHGMSMVLGKDKEARYHFILCNRAKGNYFSEYTTTKALLSPKSLREEMISQLCITHESMRAFAQMLKKLDTKDLGGFKQKAQDVGNCGLAASKGAAKAVFEWYTDETIAEEIYKALTHDFMREKALQEYLDQTVEPDIELLKQLLEKYINEKTTLVLSDAVVAQLDRIIGQADLTSTSSSV